MTRYYDPEIGRFVNADDVSYLDPETLNGCNLYAYCGNDPINYFDPDGTFSISAVAGSKIALVFLGILALIYIESQTHIIENFVENIVDMTQNLTQNITANDSSIVVDSSISAIKTERKNKNPQDPYARPNQKKQGRERKAKARKGPSWEPRSGKRRISPPKKHTPGRDHRHFFVFLVWLWNFFE